MALRIGWDEFEVALLIDACEQVLNGNANKTDIVSQLSAALRLRAVNNGIIIDDIFRNENGISLQMTKMDYLLTNGRIGLPGASKLYAEIAKLRKDHPSEFDTLLKEAKEQIKEKRAECELSTKVKFKQCLSAKPSKKHSVETIIQALEEGSDYCRTHSICKESFWDIKDKAKFSAVTSKLLGMKFYRLMHRNTATVLDRAVPMYKEFLSAPDTVEKSVVKKVDTAETRIKPESVMRPQVNSLKNSLDKTLDYLRTRYDVRLHYDHLSNPDHNSCDMLYKVRNSKKDIMWVYLIDSKSAHYISIETEPEYLEDMKGTVSGFTRVQIRTSHPCQKMFFEDYESVKESLVAICDSIDLYFAASAMLQPQEDRMRLYQKLYSISRVYDDHSGLAISKIMSLVGKEADEQLVRAILDDASWATKVAEDIYSFSRKTPSVVREPDPSSRTKSNDAVFDSDFYAYLHDELGMAEATCRSYVSAIRTAENYAQKNNLETTKIYGVSVAEALSAIQNLLSNEAFIEFNVQQHNRFSAAFVKFSECVGQSIPSSARVADPKSEPTDFDKDKFEQTLLRRYRNGMQFDSIDFENFLEMYEMLFDEKLSFTDSELEERLRYCGVLYKDRLFPAEGIIDSITREKLFTYIENSFASGKKVLYYKAILEDLADYFESCFALSDENMLRTYIEFTAEKGKYFFFTNYMSVERNVSINHNDEVEEYFLNVGKPIATDAVCDALSHIPKDQVVRIIKTDSRFLRNAKGEYFHTETFEVSDSELDHISEIINALIEENGYAIWTDVWNVIQDKMPVFIENNLYLSGLGIRNALAQRLVDRFNFESAVISLPEDQYAMRDVYQLYAKHHATFSAEDIYNLSKELDTVIYFDALAEVAFRVSKDMFVSKQMLNFDVDAIDKAIESFISKDYIRVREIDSFLAFPNVGYEWNEYLLESFVYSYSKKFSLLNNGFSLNNVAGAVVKKTGSIHEFVDACAAVLADGPISLNNRDALNYLAEVNMITRRSYKDLDQALRKAAQIRARKG